MKKRTGFTLVEVIVVVALMALAFSAISATLSAGNSSLRLSDARAQDTVTASILVSEVEKQIGLASVMNLYNYGTFTATNDGGLARIYANADNRIVVERDGQAPVYLAGQENLPDGSQVDISFRILTDSAQSVEVTISITRSASVPTFTLDTVMNSMNLVSEVTAATIDTSYSVLSFTN